MLINEYYPHMLRFRIGGLSWFLMVANLHTFCKKENFLPNDVGFLT